MCPTLEISVAQRFFVTVNWSAPKCLVGLSAQWTSPPKTPQCKPKSLGTESGTPNENSHMRFFCFVHSLSKSKHFMTKNSQNEHFHWGFPVPAHSQKALVIKDFCSHPTHWWAGLRTHSMSPPSLSLSQPDHSVAHWPEWVVLESGE